jgi:gamma-glutamylputrescine oxidase
VGSATGALNHRVTTDVVVIGGGMAGLHAALRLNTDGARVVLLEKSFCGGGMSGLSSGLVAPDSELGLAELIHRFGADRAHALWSVAAEGVQLIASTAQANGFPCDLEQCDSLFVGVGRRGADAVRDEWEARHAAGHDVTHYAADALDAWHPGGYSAGLRARGTWTIDPLAYCRSLKAMLVERGVEIFEHTEVGRLDGTTAVTPQGAATGRAVVCCANQLSKTLSPAAYEQYSLAETCLTVSRPLSPDEIVAIFPAGRLQCWDSRLIYSYYRLTADNRLLLGGGSIWMTIAGRATPIAGAVAAGIARFKGRFPALAELSFERSWAGLIDVTRDLVPVAAADPERPNVFVILGCAGLPWAAWCGDQMARQLGGGALPGVWPLFGWNRAAFVPPALQRLIGKPAGFALDFLAIKAGARYRG